MFDCELYTNILREELVPALGCTEPISIAYGSAMCKKYLSDIPESVEIQCSGNIIKNVKGVVVPNTNGMKGLETAVAIGIFGGDPSKGLEVLSSVDAFGISQAETFLKKNAIKVSLLNTEAKLHFIVTMVSKNHSSSVEIIHAHTNIVSIVQDGKSVFSKPFIQKDSHNEGLDYSCLTVQDIITYCETVDLQEIELIIGRQIDFNSAICQEGLTQNWGAMVGKQILGYQGNSLLARLKAVTAAGSDARMSGCVSPVIINSGSGNQGLTVSMPVIEFASSINATKERTIRALALSNLVAIHQKTKIGWLSAYCGVSTAACGAGAGITWLCGGSPSQIDNTISNSLATISGMICDGAKPSCAAKIAIAVESAFLGHSMAMDKNNYVSGDGIVKNTLEETINGIGTIASLGMQETDKIILSVMLS